MTLERPKKQGKAEKCSTAAKITKSVCYASFTILEKLTAIMNLNHHVKFDVKEHEKPKRVKGVHGNV